MDNNCITFVEAECSAVSKMYLLGAPSTKHKHRSIMTNYYIRTSGAIFVHLEHSSSTL
jgi:hypothetical protein